MLKAAAHEITKRLGAVGVTALPDRSGDIAPEALYGRRRVIAEGAIVPVAMQISFERHGVAG
jgi:hypothetical protein